MYFPTMALSWVITIANTITLGNSKSQSSIEFNKNQTNKNIISISNEKNSEFFQMPLHYPRYTKHDYEKMEEWKIDALLREYGLNFQGSVDEKRRFAIGAFLWPNQL
ncbi:hypothetical protein EJD97_008155 [Solanum chilense]|uniref:DUF7722 domain-containing protein n=1 Tax=Solanum chilense TaxID=4083 RepID=A0A6N2BMP7_SOLCI|nr:hypothetical protein EJD97_008155 [Solanum chilense]